MMIYKLATTLMNPESPEWEKLSAEELGTGVHPDRKMGFFLSREALSEALKEAGLKVPIYRLKLKSYHELPEFPHLTISLSHTKTCGAALLAERKIFRSVGIDIEEETRIVKDSIRERISHPKDHNFRNIELWCAKEAAFKALMNSGMFERPLEFGSIQILPKIWVHSPSGLSGEWEMHKFKQVILSLAFLKN